MTYEIEGWIEVTYCHGVEQEEEHAWLSLINIGTLAGPSAVSERLFGLSKRCTLMKSVPDALAARRGVPANSSQRVRHDLEAIRLHEERYEPGEVGGYTHATWQEIQSAFAQHLELEGGGWDEAGGWNEWKLVFDLARQLEASRRYSASQIRLVVWHVW